jgi:hypothetical protein
MRVHMLLAGSVAALIAVSCASAAATPVPSGYATAEDACRASAGAGGDWTTVARVDRPALADRPTGSVLVMQPSVPDGNVGTCLTYRLADGGGFGLTTFAIGRFALSSPQPLTYASAVQTQDDTPEVLLGRAPADATTVRLLFGDGSTQVASVGGGFWVAWLGAPADPVAIEARDATGAVVGKVADPRGVRPGP